jgi:hypothetical protein
VATSRINFRNTDAGYRELLHRTFRGDMDEDRFLAFANGLVPDDPARIAADELGPTRQRWGSIPGRTC